MSENGDELYDDYEDDDSEEISPEEMAQARKDFEEQRKTVITLPREPLFQRLFMETVEADDVVDPDDKQVLLDFARYVVGPLSEHFGTVSAKGGAFFAKHSAQDEAKFAHVRHDQTMRAHLINGMLPALRIMGLLKRWGANYGRHWTDTTKRLFIAGFMLHDYTKIEAVKKFLETNGFRGGEPISEQKRPVIEGIFIEWCERLKLNEFLQPLGGAGAVLHALMYVALNTQQLRETAHAPTLLPNKAVDSQIYMLATEISHLADLLAYARHVHTPRALVADGTIARIIKDLAYTNQPVHRTVGKLVYHHVAENRGLLLNFIHDAALKALTVDDQRVPLLFAPSGVVYLERDDAPQMPAPDGLVERIVQQTRRKVADTLIAKKKALKLGKDGLRIDDVYRDAFNLREFVQASSTLAQRVTTNAPQYMEKLMALGYPGSDTLPAYSTDPKDGRLRQMAEWASLLEIQYDERAPTLAGQFRSDLLQGWKLSDLSEAFEAVRMYKPAGAGGTGIRYHWYWASAHALARQAGIAPVDPASIQEWLDQLSDQLASALPEELPASALPNEQIWTDLHDYVGRVLTLGGSKSAVVPQPAELNRYARAKAGRGGAVCAICGGDYKTRKPAETAVAFQPGVYTGRIRIGASDNARNLCSICALEQLLRQLFVDNLDSGGTAEGQRVRYLSFYPSYFFTPETLGFIRRLYSLLKDIRLSDKEFRRALIEQVDLQDARFWQRLDPFLMRAADQAASKRVLRYSDDAQATFLMVGFRNFNDPRDSESWVLPAFLSLVLPICLDVKVVASESGVPLLLESDELPETVWFDGAHSAIQDLVTAGRVNVDEVLPALARLTAAYLIHLDTEYDPPKENWHRLPPIAHSLMESPLYVFHHLKRQSRDDRPIGAAQIRRYVAYADAIFNPQGDVLMSYARELVTLYRRFYRVRRPFSTSSYTLLRPIDIVADTLLNADSRLFNTADALIEIARGQLHDRLESSETDAIFIRSRAGEQAMREFCETFVNDVFVGVFNCDVAALRGKQLNLLRSACEVLYLDMQNAEWAERGQAEDTSNDGDETDNSE